MVKEQSASHLPSEVHLFSVKEQSASHLPSEVHLFSVKEQSASHLPSEVLGLRFSTFLPLRNL